MNRLTKRNKMGTAMSNACEYCEHDYSCTECNLGKVIDKLAAYEDTGLLPEEVEKLKTYKLMEVVALNNLLNDEFKKYKELEEQGLLINLPCKVDEKTKEQILFLCSNDGNLK